MRESVRNGALMAVDSLSCELLTKHTKGFIVNAMSKGPCQPRYLPDEKSLSMLRTTDETPGWGRRYAMWGVSLLCCAGLFLGGCVVPKGKYETTVAALEVTKTELKKRRMQYEALEEENEKLLADHEKAAFDLEMLSAEIEQIKESQRSERDVLADREAQLQNDRATLASKLREIQHVHQQLKSQNRALRDAVRRYEKDLKEAREAMAKSAAQASRASKKTGTESSRVVAKNSSSKPAPPPVAVPFNETVTPVNINIASTDDLELFLGFTKEEADKVVLNRPYRLRGELVSKQVVPKATFDVIKDRITAAPQ